MLLFHFNFPSYWRFYENSLFLWYLFNNKHQHRQNNRRNKCQKGGGLQQGCTNHAKGNAKHERKPRKKLSFFHKSDYKRCAATKGSNKKPAQYCTDQNEFLFHNKWVPSPFLHFYYNMFCRKALLTMYTILKIEICEICQTKICLFEVFRR